MHGDSDLQEVSSMEDRAYKRLVTRRIGSSRGSLQRDGIYKRLATRGRIYKRLVTLGLVSIAAQEASYTEDRIYKKLVTRRIGFIGS